MVSEKELLHKMEKWSTPRLKKESKEDTMKGSLARTLLRWQRKGESTSKKKRKKSSMFGGLGGGNQGIGEIIIDL